MALANPAVREVASGHAARHSQQSLRLESFGEASPIAWRAYLAAFREATDFVNKEPRQAELSLLNSGEKDPVDNLRAAMRSPENALERPKLRRRAPKRGPHFKLPGRMLPNNAVGILKRSSCGC